MKKTALLLTVLFGLGVMATAQAGGSGMGGNPPKEVGAVHLGQPCGENHNTKK